MFRVMVYVYFMSQDGYDYMAGEYSGCYHETIEEAQKELEEAKRYCKESGNPKQPYIEEVEE